MEAVHRREEHSVRWEKEWRVSELSRLSAPVMCREHSLWFDLQGSADIVMVLKRYLVCVFKMLRLDAAVHGNDTR